MSKHFLTRFIIFTRKILDCSRVSQEVFRRRSSQSTTLTKINHSGMSSSQSHMTETRRCGCTRSCGMGFTPPIDSSVTRGTATSVSSSMHSWIRSVCVATGTPTARSWNWTCGTSTVFRTLWLARTWRCITSVQFKRWDHDIAPQQAHRWPRHSTAPVEPHSFLYLLNHRHLPLQHHLHIRSLVDELLVDLRGFSLRHTSVISILALGLDCGQFCKVSVVIHHHVVGHLRLFYDCRWD